MIELINEQMNLARNKLYFSLDEPDFLELRIIISDTICKAYEMGCRDSQEIYRGSPDLEQSA